MGGTRHKSVLVAAFVVLLAALLWLFWPEETITHPPGVLVPEEPRQSAVASLSAWRKDEYTITPLAEFRARARVLHTKTYHRGRESDLSPIDLALGWGDMSDQRVVDRIDVSQSGRWYEWRCSKLPIPRQAIVRSSANMHMIPADDSVEQRLFTLRVGDIIAFDGYLVDVRSDDGWHWRSSLSRTDEGNGACELVWVKHLSRE